jgi:protein-tyrosine phosphatase
MEEICVKVLEKLYIGSYKTAMSKTTLKSNKITHILCVGNEMENLHKPNEFKFMKLQVDDSEDENILFNFESVFNFIEEGREKGGVLIHCYGGISRSPTITAAYIMKKYNKSYEETLKMLTELKPDINPNEGFRNKLEFFEKIVNKPIENFYKCSICRKTLFDDSNIDLEHEFTPKKNYSYKRFKKSFVNTNDCAAYFLNSLSFVDSTNEYGEKLNCPNKNVRKLIF